MNILLTAFDPFGGDDTNSSMMTLEKVSDCIDNVKIHKMIVPTVYKESAEAVAQKANQINADCVLCMGQAGGRRNISVEVIAINYALADLCDNKNNRYLGEKLVENGENALFATVPVKKMVDAVKKKGFEASLSASAGAFVCNSLLYLLLSKLSVPVGFVHLPYAKEQGKDAFSMDAEDMALCIEEMIKTIKNSERICNICAE